MVSRKNLPENIEARRQRAAARNAPSVERGSYIAKIDDEPLKQDKIDLEAERQPAHEDLKMYALFFATVVIVTIARQIADKGFAHEATLTNFGLDCLSNVFGLGVVWVISTATISRFHRYFLGKEYDDQEPKSGDFKPSFFYLLVIVIVISVLAILGAYSTPSDWQD